MMPVNEITIVNYLHKININEKTLSICCLSTSFTGAGARTSSSMEQPGHAQAMSVERIAAELKTFTMNAADIVIAKNGSTALTITAKDESDADVNLGNVTYTIKPEAPAR